MAVSDRWRTYAGLCSTRVRDALGLTAAYTDTSTGTTYPLEKAPFDEAHEEIIITDGVPDSVRQPVWDVILSDLPVYPALGDVVELTPVGGVSTRYVVQDIQPGGQGTAKLFMTLETAP